MPTDYLGLNQTGSGPYAAPDIGGDSYEVGVQDDREQLKEAHRRNIALGVLAAGLATMGAQPRGWRQRTTIGEALGEGGLAGLNVYGGAEAQLAKERDARRKEALERAHWNLQFQQTQELRNIQQSTLEERVRQDKAIDKLTGELRDTQAAGQKSTEQFRGKEEARWIVQDRIAQQNADALSGLRNADEGLKNLQIQQMEPGGVDTLQGLRKAKNLPEGTPSAEQIKAMPAKDALAWQRTVYETLAKGGKNANIHFLQMKDGWHEIVTDPASGKMISDTFRGPSATKGGNANREALRRLTGLPDETGATPPTAASSATPGAAPTAAPAPAGAPPSRPLPTVGHTANLPDGQYHMAGKIFTIKNHTVMKIDDAPSVSTAAE